MIIWYLFLFFLHGYQWWNNSGITQEQTYIKTQQLFKTILIWLWCNQYCLQSGLGDTSFNVMWCPHFILGWYFCCSYGRWSILWKHKFHSTLMNSSFNVTFVVLSQAGITSQQVNTCISLIVSLFGFLSMGVSLCVLVFHNYQVASRVACDWLCK